MKLRALIRRDHKPAPASERPNIFDYVVARRKGRGIVGANVDGNEPTILLLGARMEKHASDGSIELGSAYVCLSDQATGTRIACSLRDLEAAVAEVRDRLGEEGAK